MKSALILFTFSLGLLYIILWLISNFAIWVQATGLF